MIVLPRQSDAGIARPAADRRSAAAVGRAARLELVFEARRGRTILAHAYAEPPFRVGRALYSGDAAYLILGCTGAGVFAGDALTQSVRVAAGARVVLVSQSALQAHPSAAPAAASIEQQYSIEDGAELVCHWDPVIPFAGARLTQRFEIDLAASSRFCWGDAIMAGRVRRGEAWRFDTLAHELRLTVAGALTYLERYTLAPARHPVEPTWIAGPARYVATALVHHPGATADSAAALQSAAQEACPERAERVERAWAGVDLVAPRTIVGRILARDGAPFSRARAAFLAKAHELIFGGPWWTPRK